MKICRFRIAKKLLKVVLPNDCDWEKMLPSYAAFYESGLSDDAPLCTLEIMQDKVEIDLSGATLLADLPNIMGNRLQLRELSDNYVIDIQLVEGGSWYKMVCNKSFSAGQAFIGKEGNRLGETLNLFLMIMFAQAAVSHRTVLIHASVVEKEGKGYAFLGKSGTGKSTHSSLWMRYVEGVELLNDDNPAIGIEDDGRVYVYGTPWSGKTPCYKNRKAQLAALVRLEQAPVNHFMWKSGKNALISLIPSCSSMRWSDMLFTALCDLLEVVIEKVPVGYLECLPDETAVNICYSEVVKLEKQ